MYSFNQRSDTVALDEPFYGIWLAQNNRRHPNFDEILQTLECHNADKILDLIEEKENVKGNVFVKNMANTVKYMNQTRVLNYRPLILIRHPAETIVSHAKIAADITAEDLCLKDQVQLYDYFKERRREDPVVIDGNELRRDPSSILSQVCHRLDLPFTEEMLSWPPGPKSIDGLWAAARHKDVHASSGFLPPSPSSIQVTKENIPKELISVYDQALPHYQKMFSHCIRA
ncbi:unnamed protein product [Adineta steineri]|uniref:Sulfotransferase family protein n=1 Tax=Adineta steineri TaxID=433720 RepID=A0A814WWC7_9BILA|nr:unnamed protein product [Adineta steineri]CAF3780581.1 unnamed protein product [Adineta steineri]